MSHLQRTQTAFTPTSACTNCWEMEICPWMIWQVWFPQTPFSRQNASESWRRGSMCRVQRLWQTCWVILLLLLMRSADYRALINSTLWGRKKEFVISVIEVKPTCTCLTDTLLDSVLLLGFFSLLNKCLATVERHQCLREVFPLLIFWFGIHSQPSLWELKAAIHVQQNVEDKGGGL